MNNLYFNHASISPMLSDVRKEIDAFLDRYMDLRFNYLSIIKGCSYPIKQHFGILVGSKV